MRNVECGLRNENFKNLEFDIVCFHAGLENSCLWEAGAIPNVEMAVQVRKRTPNPLKSSELPLFRHRKRDSQSSNLPAGPLSAPRREARSAILLSVQSEGFSILATLGPRS